MGKTDNLGRHSQTRVRWCCGGDRRKCLKHLRPLIKCTRDNDHSSNLVHRTPKSVRLAAIQGSIILGPCGGLDIEGRKNASTRRVPQEELLLILGGRQGMPGNSRRVGRVDVGPRRSGAVPGDSQIQGEHLVSDNVWRPSTLRLSTIGETSMDIERALVNGRKTHTGGLGGRRYLSRDNRGQESCKDCSDREAKVVEASG